MLYLQHHFYNIIFEIEHKLYTASGSNPPEEKIQGAPLEGDVGKVARFQEIMVRVLEQPAA
jgi:hypothetical protein